MRAVPLVGVMLAAVAAGGCGAAECGLDAKCGGGAPPQEGEARTPSLERLEQPGARAPGDLAEKTMGGARIACDEGVVDFGTAAVGVPWTARVRCVNTGDLPAAALVAATENPAFRVALPEGRIGPGASFDARIIFEPTEAGEAASAVRLGTQGDDTAFAEIRAAGRAIAVQPCDLELSTDVVDFHRVQLQSSATLAVDLINVGNNDCLVHGMALQSTDPGYVLPGVQPNFTVPAGGHVTVPVQFWPSYDFATDGVIEFQVSHPGNPLRRIDVHGMGTENCLVLEGDLRDFGSAAPGCATPERRFTIGNTCGTPVTVEGIGFVGSGFRLSQPPALPTTLGRTERTAFNLAFSPDFEGEYFGGVLVFTDHVGGPQLFTMHGTGTGAGTTVPVQVDTFEQISRPKVDVLVVVDTSPGAADLRQALEQNLQALLAFATTHDVDFQLGVTTTGIDGSGCSGGVGSEAGRLLPLDLIHPRIFTETTIGLPAAWADAIPDGSCVQRRSAFDAVVRALALSAVFDDPSTPEASDGNLGFLRDDAHLAVLFVTDGDDESLETDWPALANALFHYKGPEKYSLHALAPRDPGMCGGQTPASRILEATALGASVDRCSTNFTDSILDLGPIVTAVPARYPLRAVPGDMNLDGDISDVSGDMIVRRNGVVEPSVDAQHGRVWGYQWELNAVDFSPLSFAQVGDTIEIEYHVGCLPPQPTAP